MQVKCPPPSSPKTRLIFRAIGQVKTLNVSYLVIMCHFLTCENRRILEHTSHPSHSHKMYHITDLYFYEEISKILGCPCKVKWLRSVSNIEYRLRQRRHIPQQRTVLSSKRVLLSNQPKIETCTPIIPRQPRVDSYSSKEKNIEGF